MRSFSLHWILVTCIALVLLCASFVPSVWSATQSVYRVKELQRSALLGFLHTSYVSLRMQFSGNQTAYHLALLEQENRKLSAALATQSAQSRLQGSDSAILDQGTLSRDLSGWFVIQDTPQLVSANTPVYQQGVLLGEVVATSSGVLPLAMVSLRTTPLLVQHQPTGQIGSLSVLGKTPVVEFFERVSTISVGDVFTTLPSRTGAPAAAIGSVEAIQTQQSDPVSIVQVRLLGKPMVGDRVEVGQ